MTQPRSAALVAVMLSAVLALTSCTSPKDELADGAPSSSSRSETTSSVKEPEIFTGAVEDFYVAPDPLPHGEPGELIRVQELGDTSGQHTVRVMYHSRDAQDRDRAVTGIVTYPTGAPPEGGWTVTSQANGTVGLASQCAPSRTGAPARDWGIEGVHADTDYIGLGPVGEIHPYLSGPSEGNSVIDAVRAARNLPAAHAGKTWFSVGHSQGGHGAIFAGERADKYAPELDLLGTVALAPAPELAKNYGPVDEVVSRVVGVMMIYGASGEHPEIRFEDYAGPELLAVSDVFESGCLDQIIAATAGIPGDKFYAHDPLKTEPAASLLKLNQPGLVVSDAPLFLAQGTVDERVNVHRTEDYFARVCKLGQVVDLLVVEGENHGGIVGASASASTEWMKARLAGDPAPNSCP